jgi:hypothetical protein
MMWTRLKSPPAAAILGRRVVLGVDDDNVTTFYLAFALRKFTAASDCRRNLAGDKGLAELLVPGEDGDHPAGDASGPTPADGLLRQRAEGHQGEIRAATSRVALQARPPKGTQPPGGIGRKRAMAAKRGAKRAIPATKRAAEWRKDLHRTHGYLRSNVGEEEGRALDAELEIAPVQIVRRKKFVVTADPAHRLGCLGWYSTSSRRDHIHRPGSIPPGNAG